MTFPGLIPYIRNQTLQLGRIAGRMMEAKETEEHICLLEAKAVAKDMAIEMKMREGLESWESTPRLSREQKKQFVISVGVLAKACEAFDHIEDYPYRENIERSIREILNL